MQSLNDQSAASSLRVSQSYAGSLTERQSASDPIDPVSGSSTSRQSCLPLSSQVPMIVKLATLTAS